MDGARATVVILEELTRWWVEQMAVRCRMKIMLPDWLSKLQGAYTAGEDLDVDDVSWPFGSSRDASGRARPCGRRS